MSRIVGSLRLGVVEPLELMRILQNDGHPSTLARAIGEIGRIAKSLYMPGQSQLKVKRRGLGEDSLHSSPRMFRLALMPHLAVCSCLQIECQVP